LVSLVTDVAYKGRPGVMDYLNVGDYLNAGDDLTTSHPNRGEKKKPSSVQWADMMRRSTSVEETVDFKDWRLPGL